MPSLADAAKSILPGWGYYTGAEVDKANTENQYGQQFLRDMQQYDPSAHYEQVNQYGGSDGDNVRTMMRLIYDPSKLPNGGTPGMVDMNAGAYNGMYNDGAEHSYGGNLFKPDAVTNDANGYGRVTSPRNMNLAADHHSAVDTYGPMIVALIASLGAAAPALAAGNATLGSFSTGTGGALANGLVNGARALDNGGGLSSLVPAAISAGGSALGLPSYVTSGANAAYGISQGRRPSPVGAGMSLAQIIANSVGPGG
jgi:hypothetical protein